MNSSPEVISVLASTLPGDNGALKAAPLAARRSAAPIQSGGSGAPVVTAGGPTLAMIGTSREAANARNTTVLPEVESSGVAVKLKPRKEARYQRVRTLGAGAMGEVSLALDNDIGRTVAVKRLTGRTNNAAGIARFIEEIHTIGQLEHPNIVPIHDVGVDDQGQVFFVMKHIDGETLESILAKLEAGDPEYIALYPIDRRIEIFLGILRALQCAHQKGVIHRDLKPAEALAVPARR